MGLAGLKTTSMLFLVVLVALAGVSPVFASDGFTFPIALTPTSACPGAIVSISWRVPIDIVGGGISIAAVSPLDGGIEAVVSSDPGGLIASDPQECSVVGPSGQCTFLVSESASCGRYTVTVALTLTSQGTGTILEVGSGSAVFEVPSTCPSCASVGGCVQPVNTFALVSPWLAVIGLVGCIGTVAVVVKKRHQWNPS